MEDILIWIFWAVMIVVGIASSAAKAKKKQQEAARRISTDDVDEDSGQRSKPVRSFADVLRELAEQANDGPAEWPTPAARPVSVGRPIHDAPVPTSFDSYSLEDDYVDTDSEYVFGRDGGSTAHTVPGSTVHVIPTHAMSTHTMSTRTVMAAEPVRTGAEAEDEDGGERLAEMLGGEFDLRRAVIEAEILTPKYAARY